MRLIFMGSPEFAVPSLRTTADSGWMAGVITQPARPKGRGQKVALSPIAHECLQMGIEPMMPDSVKTPQFLEEFKRLKPDIGVVVAYGKILPPEIITRVMPHARMPNTETARQVSRCVPHLKKAPSALKTIPIIEETIQGTEQYCFCPLCIRLVNRSMISETGQ